MKKFKSTSAYILLLALLIFFNSCNQDDEIFDNSLVANTTSTNTETGGTTETSTGTTGSDTDTSNDSSSDNEITLYRVEGENIVKIKDYNVTGDNLAYQQDVQKHNEIWNVVKKVVPLSYRSKMSEFLIYNGTAEGSAGFVVNRSQDLSKWLMGISIVIADDMQELTYVVIHEFGHILTLNNDQLNSSIGFSACTNYFPGEGCSKKDSYINKLQTRYWADIWEQFKAASEVGESKLQEFYENHSSRYVTQYASTNPGEDIAEVFATFVTRDSGANGSSIAEQKIQLMYDHSELVSIREYIRNNLNPVGRGISTKSLLPEPGSWKNANKLGGSCIH